MRTSFGILNVLLTVAFLLSVLVQYNDPDALVWIAMYGIAAAVCIAFAMGRMKIWYACAVAAVAAVWAVALVPSFWGSVSFDELYESFEMKSQTVERAREFGGLLIVVVWMVALSAYSQLGLSRSRSREDGDNAPR